MQHRYQKYILYSLCLYFVSSGYAIDLYDATIKAGQKNALYPSTYNSPLNQLPVAATTSDFIRNTKLYQQ